MPKTVAIVLEPDFSDRLEKIAFHTPVWLVDTPPNRSAAELAWSTAVEWPHITVTLFNFEDWKSLLKQMDVLAFDVLDVIGEPLTDESRSALTKHGFDKFEAREGGFKARR